MNRDLLRQPAVPLPDRARLRGRGPGRRARRRREPLRAGLAGPARHRDPEGQPSGRSPGDERPGHGALRRRPRAVRGDGACPQRRHHGAGGRPDAGRHPSSRCSSTMRGGRRWGGGAGPSCRAMLSRLVKGGPEELDDEVAGGKWQVAGGSRTPGQTGEGGGRPFDSEDLAQGRPVDSATDRGLAQGKHLAVGHEPGRTVGLARPTASRTGGRQQSRPGAGRPGPCSPASNAPPPIRRRLLPGPGRAIQGRPAVLLSPAARLAPRPLRAGSNATSA